MTAEIHETVRRMINTLVLDLVAQSTLNIAAAAPADLFSRGNAAYEAGDYAQAVALYDSAAAGMTVFAAIVTPLASMGAVNVLLKSMD